MCYALRNDARLPNGIVLSGRLHSCRVQSCAQLVKRLTIAMHVGTLPGPNRSGSRGSARAETILGQLWVSPAQDREAQRSMEPARFRRHQHMHQPPLAQAVTLGTVIALSSSLAPLLFYESPPLRFGTVAPSSWLPWATSCRISAICARGILCYITNVTSADARTREISNCLSRVPCASDSLLGLVRPYVIDLDLRDRGKGAGDFGPRFGSQFRNQGLL